jgi:D-glycero-D-manno-heptose 1,7-bisphosphate phosphatase
MNKAIFLDRDGTINEDVNYLSEINNLRIIPNAIEALRKFKNSGFLNIVITNQSGIARGFFYRRRS